MESKLIIKNMTFKYINKKILNDISLQLNQGINVLLGQNGSGKTTLIKILATLLNPNEGKILLDDIDYREKRLIKQNMAYLPQKFDVYPQLKCSEFLKFIAQIKLGNNHSKIKNEIERVVELTDINGFIDVKMKNCSQGMLRRIGIAQAMIGKPKLILVDEPTAGLDPEQCILFNMAIQKIQTESIVLLSTHIVDDIRDYSDKIVVLKDGHLAFEGNFDKFRSSIVQTLSLCIMDTAKFSKAKREHSILRYENYKGKVACRIIGDVDERLFTSVTRVEPTLQDIWLYHQKRGKNYE